MAEKEAKNTTKHHTHFRVTRRNNDKKLKSKFEVKYRDSLNPTEY